MTSNDNLRPDTFGKAVGNLYLCGPANMSWERALSGLSEAEARQKPPHLPHSVADIVAHVQFWQAYLLDVIDGVDKPSNRSADGWPAVDDWAQLQADFLRDSARLRELARDPAFVQTSDRKGRPYGVALTLWQPHWAEVERIFNAAPAPTHAVPTLLDWNESQFVWRGGFPYALVDVEASAYAPPELDLTFWEVLLDASQASSFRAG